MSISFNPRQYTMRYRDATKRAASQTLASTHTYIFRVENAFNAYVNYKHTLSRAIHHICKVKSTARKSNNLLWLTEIEHISFALLCLQRNSDTRWSNAALQHHRLKLRLIQTWITVECPMSMLIRGIMATCAVIRRREAPGS